MGCEICQYGAGRKALASIAEENGYTMQEVFDRMLLPLYDALLLRMALQWSKDRVTNLHVCQVYEVAKWWMLGMQVGSAPIFDGVCAQCGCLLHGKQYENNSLSNKTCAPPSDRDGNALPRLPDGSPQVLAPPPFLLRYSPHFFAKDDSAPSWFVYHKRTNRLSLKPGVYPPWIRVDIPAGEQAVWYYCNDCKDRYFPASGQRSHSHIPYRDKASQHWIRPIRRFRQVQRAACSRGATAPAAVSTEATEPAPPNEQHSLVGDVDAEASGSDAEDGVEETGAELQPPDEDIDEDDAEDTFEKRRLGAFAARGYVPKNINEAPEVPPPTLEQYQQRWDERLATHSREVPGAFSRDNLVPKPIPDR